jgi:GntR family negative regulator for fad regulon and positive regulator of fabA
VQLGVTRPTLREALQRLERDGWLTIQQGKATRINEFWQQGGLSLLSTLVRHSQALPPHFVPHLLDVRLALAPAYARAAVARSAEVVIALLADHVQVSHTPASYAAYDWRVHHTLTVASGNPVYTLILNGFAGFYEEMARQYFALAEARAASQRFYAELGEAAHQGDARRAEETTRAMMAESIVLWHRACGVDTVAGAPPIEG